MNVLDLFAGLGGWSAPFRDRGHDVCIAAERDVPAGKAWGVTTLW